MFFYFTLTIKIYFMIVLLQINNDGTEIIIFNL